MRDLREGGERRRRVPVVEEWRWRREEMSFGRERPEERTTRPPFGSSRSSPIICSWNWTILVVVVVVKRRVWRLFVAGRFDFGIGRLFI